MAHPEPPQRETATPSLYHNRISWFATGMAGYTFSLMAILHLTNLLLGRPNPYLGVLTYLVLPLFLVLGLVGIPLGMWIEAVRRRRRGGVAALPVLDLNVALHRARFVRFWLASFVFVIMVAFVAYSGYHFTESVYFCGQTCHRVMEPTFTAYQASPHARVACTECHIGSGASWWVRSKFSGVYQVYAYTFDRYERPLSVPIASLRPARDTCEECHWPAKFYDSILRRRRYYSADESNRAWEIHLEIPVGGGQGPLAAHGVHWHVLPENRVEYVAADAARQVIPWVRVTRPDGSQIIYEDPANRLDEGALASASIRQMDCIDCHNQPSHIFRPPGRAVDEALAAGAISPALPYIRQVGVEALLGDYPTREAAEQGIRLRVTEFYRKEYPERVAADPSLVETAIEALTAIYRANFFPEMRTDWRSYPNNLGHLYSPGCMRCHDGQHVSPQGQAITADCKVCHRIVAQGPAGELQWDPKGLNFLHPMDESEMTQPDTCWSCHDGT